MGNMVADAMREKYPGVEAAFTNSGGLRADLNCSPAVSAGEQPCEITWGEMFSVLPFGNRTVIETLTGAQLTTAFENGFSPEVQPGDRAPAASRRSPGSRSTYHCNGPAAGRSTGIWKTPDGIGGPLTPVGATDSVRFVTNDFMYTGGDGYTVFARAPTSSSRATTCSRSPSTTWTAHSPVGPVVDGRIVGRRPRAARQPTSRPRPGPSARPRRFPGDWVPGGAAVAACPTIGRVTPELKATLATLPDRPGVYLMKDARGEVLYVGKAQSLRSRVRSYWQKQAPGGRGEVHRIRQAIDRVVDLEVTEVDSVSEALLLEANLIKRFKPRFNVRLKDDKSYPYIKITLGDDFPRIERTRKLPNDGSRYFGPYASASSVDEAMNLVRRLFPFRTCTIDIREGVRALPRPCLLYHIKRCQGPCVEAISKAAYRRDIAQVELFLEGNADALRRRPAPRDGTSRPSSEQYEKAAVVRDKIRSIERTMESQKMAAFARTELDLVAMARKDDQAAVQLFVVRNGKMLGRDVFFLDAPRDVADDEVLGQLPAPVLRPRHERPARGARPALARRHGGPRGVPGRPKRGTQVSLRTPQRGEKRELMELAPATRPSRWPGRPPAGSPTRARRSGALQELAAALGLPGPPMRIECYDISNFQGAQSVGSMVVFEEGRPRTGEYRRFQIRTVQGANDFASHQEVLRRRFRGAKAGEEGIEEERRWAMPDLVIVDGGRGQVSAASEVLEELGLGDLPLAGLAKEREELILPDRDGAGRAAGHLAGALPRPAPARRGPPVRDHVPPQPAQPEGGQVGVRRPAGRGPEAQARAAQGLRVGEARARGAGRADRGRAGHRARAGGADQGPPRGLMPLAPQIEPARAACSEGTRRRPVPSP